MARGDNYAVGYGKPPKHARFVKGRSGNPSGKKTGTRSLKADLADELATLVTVVENGRKVKLAKQRLMVKGAVNQAAKGSRGAFRDVVDLWLKLGQVEDGPASDAPLAPDDALILERALDRLAEARRAKKGG